MKHVAIEISLEELATFGFPATVARHAQALRLLSVTVKDFAFVCRVPKAWVPSARASIAEARSIRVEVLERGEEGSETWLVRGRWQSPRGGRKPPSPGAIRALGAMVRERVEPGSSLAFELTGDRLKVTIAAREAGIPRMVTMLKGLRIRFRVSKVGRLTAGGGAPLDTLTSQQLRILRLAYELGYYAVPRRATTEQIATRLGLDKGTVGEHLRRAERRLMESLLGKRP